MKRRAGWPVRSVQAATKAAATSGGPLTPTSGCPARSATTSGTTARSSQAERTTCQGGVQTTVSATSPATVPTAKYGGWPTVAGCAWRSLQMPSVRQCCASRATRNGPARSRNASTSSGVARRLGPTSIASDDATDRREPRGERSRCWDGQASRWRYSRHSWSGELPGDVRVRDVDEIVDVERPDTDVAVLAGSTRGSNRRGRSGSWPTLRPVPAEDQDRHTGARIPDADRAIRAGRREPRAVLGSRSRR